MCDCCESRVYEIVVKRFCITREEPERNKNRIQSSVKCMILNTSMYPPQPSTVEDGRPLAVVSVQSFTLPWVN